MYTLYKPLPLTLCPQRRTECVHISSIKNPEIKREKASISLSTAHFKVFEAFSHVSLMAWRNSGGHAHVHRLDVKGPKIKDEIQLHLQLADHNL